MIFKYLDKWSMKECKPWQFWMPQSGFYGGAVMVTVVVVILFSLFGLFSL